MDNLIAHLRRMVLAGGEADLTDGQLLEDYLRRRDEAAFAALMRRHSLMVWGVCRRVLHNDHDAEDAFQATFLVLVRKAASIMPREMVGNWLYGVAHQTALKARATTAKRQVRERQVKEMPEPAAIPEPDLCHNLEHLLDQELSRLPDKYRVAIVLCDLEGKARKEVARQLKIPEGPLSSRLTTARTMLAKRLARHGLAVSGGALAALVSQKVVSAGVPTSVVSSTIKAATLVAAGQAAATGAISLKVAALTEGVLRTMLLTKLKVVMVLFVVAGLTGAAGLLYQTQAAEEPKARRATEKADKQKQPAALDKEKQPRAADKEKQAEGQPPRKVITTAGVHELCDGKWKVEALQIEGGGDAAKNRNLKGFLRVRIINVPNHKFIAFNRTFSENWPWFVFAPSPDTVLFYDGDKEMHLVTLSNQGTLKSETTQLPKAWVALLTKQRPPPVQMIQIRGADGKVRLRPARPTDALKPYPGAKDGEIVPPPNR